jgi:hypothetical protein
MSPPLGIKVIIRVSPAILPDGLQVGLRGLWLDRDRTWRGVLGESRQADRNSGKVKTERRNQERPVHPKYPRWFVKNAVA